MVANKKPPQNAEEVNEGVSIFNEFKDSLKNQPLISKIALIVSIIAFIATCIND